MAPTVEADSLSAITSLASNPPLDPNLPVTRHEPLVLYIARVPGSRGIGWLILFKAPIADSLRCFSHAVETKRKSSYCRRCTKLALLSPHPWPNRRATTGRHPFRRS